MTDFWRAAAAAESTPIDLAARFRAKDCDGLESGYQPMGSPKICFFDEDWRWAV
jgi:hypothetical protein